MWVDLSAAVGAVMVQLRAQARVRCESLEPVQRSYVRRFRILFWVYALVWTGLLLGPEPPKIRLAPQSGGIIDFLESNLDKGVHATGYMVLAVLALAATSAARNGVRYSWVILLVALHGALTELGQWCTSTRHMNLFDWLADIFGLCLGVSLTAWYHHRGRIAGTQNPCPSPRGH